jgi:hypothetical protein
MCMSFTPIQGPREIIDNFRTERYATLNQIRWDLFLKMGIPVKDQVIFEPGAGIGDQTEWLLNQGAKHIYVNDGRPQNLDIIYQRFGRDPRLTYVHGDLEKDVPNWHFQANLIYLWGVYYHIKDSVTEFNVLKDLTRIAPLLVMEYLENDQDGIYSYGYDNPSTSLSQYGIRPTTPTMIAGLKRTWGHAYLPKEQMNWYDPLAESTPRRLAVASLHPLDNPNLLKQ